MNGIEVWHSDWDADNRLPRGWYWLCFRAPETEPFGPFQTQDEAIQDSINWEISGKEEDHD